MSHWLLVGSAENFEISRARGFDVGGIKCRWKKAAQDITIGDTIFFYLTGIKAIAGEAVVADEVYYDESPIWNSTKLGEVNCWRFPIDIVKARNPGEYLPVESFLANYQYAAKWPMQYWTLAFQGNVHRLNAHDYELIHNLL